MVLFITFYAEKADLNHGHFTYGTHVPTNLFTLEVLASRIRGIIED